MSEQELFVAGFRAGAELLIDQMISLGSIPIQRKSWTSEDEELANAAYDKWLHRDR